MVKTRHSLSTKGSCTEESVQLQDLLDAGVFSSGMKLLIKAKDSDEALFNAVLTGDGWIEDMECEEKYPDISSWIHTLLQGHEIKKKMARKKLRALVREAKSTLHQEDEEKKEEEEDGGDEQYLWNCVQIEGGKTLADVRASFVEKKKKKKDNGTKTQEREGFVENVVDDVHASCIEQRKGEKDTRTKTQEREDAIKIVAAGDVEQKNGEKETGETTREREGFVETVATKTQPIHSQLVQEKQPQQISGKKRRSSSTGSLPNEGLTKKRRRKSADDIEPPEFNSAPIVKAFRRGSKDSENKGPSSFHACSNSFAQSESSTIPPYQNLHVLETLDDGSFPLDDVEQEDTQPPVSGDVMNDCGIESTQFDSKCGVPTLSQIESQNMAQGAPQLYGERRGVESLVPSGMNKPDVNQSKEKESDKKHSQEDVRPRFSALTNESQDLEKYDAPPPTLLCADTTVKEEQLDDESTIDMTKPVIVGTSLKHELMVHLAMTVKKLGGRVSKSFDSQIVTHVVVPTDEDGIASARTAKYEQGIVTGKWVLSFQWVLDSFAALKWLPEHDYVIRGDRFTDCDESPVLKARRELEHGNKPLFYGIGFLVSSEINSELGSTIADIITAGGGRLLDRTPPPPKRQEELLVDEDLKQGESPIRVLAPKESTSIAKAQKLYIETGRHPLSCEYVMDCVSCYRLLPTIPYELQLFEESGSMNDINSVEPSLRF